jgi:hypothetical protein
MIHQDMVINGGLKAQDHYMTFSNLKASIKTILSLWSFCLFLLTMFYHAIPVRASEVGAVIAADLQAKPMMAAQNLNERAIDFGSANNPLTMYYADMRPYMYQGDSGTSIPIGMFGQRIHEIAVQAGIALDWEGPLPRTRLFASMTKDNPSCMPGASYTDERAKIYKFSLPIFPPTQWSVVVRPDADWTKRSWTLDSLLADQSLILAEMHGASKGQILDRIIEKIQPRREAFRGSPADVMAAIIAKRADYMLYIFSNQGELDASLVSAGQPIGALRLLNVEGMPTQEGARIMCTQSVPDSIIEALDRVILAMPPLRFDFEAVTAPPMVAQTGTPAPGRPKP